MANRKTCNDCCCCSDPFHPIHRVPPIEVEPQRVILLTKNESTPDSEKRPREPTVTFQRKTARKIITAWADIFTTEQLCPCERLDQTLEETSEQKLIKRLAEILAMARQRRSKEDTNNNNNNVESGLEDSPQEKRAEVLEKE